METNAGRVLICHSAQRSFPAENVTPAESPVGCLSLATSGGFARVVVIFDSDVLRELDAWVELCEALRKNPHSDHLQILAVLPSPHRALIGKLKEAGVAFARITGALKGVAQLAELMREIDESDRIDAVLSDICPFLNYLPVSRRHEMTACGAYLDRLVLGRPMLNRFCHVPGHISCPYFNAHRSSLRDPDNFRTGPEFDRRTSETKHNVE